MNSSAPSSKEILKISFDIFKAKRSLLIFPILSLASLLLILTVFALPIVYLDKTLFADFQTFANFVHEHSKDKVAQNTMLMELMSGHPGLILGCFFMYFFSFLSFSFFNGCIVACVVTKLSGGDPSISKSLQISISRLPQFIGWASLSALLGVLLRIIEQAFSRSNMTRNIAGSIATALFGAAWTLASLLVIPIIIIDGCGPIEALKKSAILFKTTWLQELGGSFKIGIYAFLIYMALFFGFFFSLMIPVGFAGHLVIGLLCLAGIVIASLAFGVLKVIYRTVLYLKVTEGQQAELAVVS